MTIGRIEGNRDREIPKAWADTDLTNRNRPGARLLHRRPGVRVRGSDSHFPGSRQIPYGNRDRQLFAVGLCRTSREVGTRTGVTRMRFFSESRPGFPDCAESTAKGGVTQRSGINKLVSI